MVRSRLSIFITVVEILALPLLIAASTAKLSALPPCAEKPGTTPSVYLSTQRSVISHILQLKNGSFPKFSSIVSSVHASGPNTTANYLFGTLETANGSIFTTLGLSYADVAKKEHDAGVAVANVTLAWKDYETSDGVFNENQMAYVANSINTFLQAGQRVDVQLAIHYVPSWVMQIPNAYYVNQCGVTAPQSYYDSPNYVFNNTVRQKVQNFETHALQQLNARVGLNNIWDFRDDWYFNSRMNYYNWQVALYRNAGFNNYLTIETPGFGTRPDEYRTNINNYLNGSGDSNGTMSRAAVWQNLYPALTNKTNIIAYVSSMGDDSGVPPNNLCQPSDMNVNFNTDPIVNTWGAVRYVSYIANKYGFLKGGENPGWGTGDDPDYGITMMDNAAKQMESCGLIGMFWAHDDRLYTTTKTPLANIITLTDYSRVINQYNFNTVRVGTGVAYSDSQGNPWSADRGFTASSTAWYC